MARRAHWLQVLLETIGLSELVAFIIGVPCMIAFISVIWHSLSRDQQIVASMLFCLMLLGVALFIYGQTRKILYIIPSLLYRRHCRITDLAEQLNIENLEDDDFKNFLSLLGIDMSSICSTLLNEKDAPSIISEALAQSQQSMDLDEETPHRAARYVSQKLGLGELLARDEIYCKMTQQLHKMQPLIPTKEIGLTVNEYTRCSESFSGLLPARKILNREILKFLPLKLQADFPRLDNDILML